MRRLILRPGAIGDCILSLPALQHLIVDYTEIWISASIVPLIGFADKVRALSSTGIDLAGVGDLAIPDRLREQLQSFDSIVSWYGSNRPEFRSALAASGIRCEFLSALPPLDFEGHASAFFAEQVGADPRALPRIQVADGIRHGSIVMHPFSGSKRKNWPLPSFRELASALKLPVEWIAGPDEELETVNRFEDLGKLAQWLSGARLYIGNDSGITHLAASVGVSTLALFGPTNPKRWSPRGPNVALIESHPLEDLPVMEVLAVANRLLCSPKA